MAALDFPASPTLNQTYTANGSTWRWDGSAWVAANVAVVADGDKGDITVSSSGTIWTVDAGAISTTKLGGDITTAGKAILDDADAAAQRATLGLAIGTNVQAWDANLDQIAALTPTLDNFIVGNGTAWALETPANARTSLGLVIGTNVQAWDADLDAIAALAGTTGLLRKTAANTWSLDTNTYLTSLGIGTLTQAWDADLDAIAALAGTSGLLRKTAANTWTLDTATYLTSAVTTINFGTTGLTPSTATSGAVTVAGTLALTNGGTGATTQAGAANAILPTQTGNSGRYLTTDGTNVSWAAVAGGGASVTISDSAPASPTAGNLWWRSSEGQLYIYYNDGNTSQWVVANAFTGGSAYLPLTGGAVTGDLSISGNVGIGTTSLLSGSDYSWVTIGGGGTNSGILSLLRSGSEAFRIQALPLSTSINTITNTPLLFSTNSTERMRIDTSGNLLFNSGYGSVATAYGCRAWVSFNGTGTVAIVGSGNVTSITDNGVGDYTANFTTAMPDGNYSFAGVLNAGTLDSNASVKLKSSTNSAGQAAAPAAKTTTACQIATGNGTTVDSSSINLCFFR